MFILYVFIYRVARALEQRSRANAQKFSKSMGNSSSLTSKSNRRPAALRSVSLCLRTKRRNKNNNDQTGIDDDAGSSFLNHQQPKRVSNGHDATNRSSSNENSAEHPAVGTIAPNITNILTISRVRDASLKILEENRSLLPMIADKVTFPNITRRKSSVRTRTSSKARKALRTITVIMGAFVLCWTPVSSERLPMGPTRLLSLFVELMRCFPLSDASLVDIFRCIVVFAYITACSFCF